MPTRRLQITHEHRITARLGNVCDDLSEEDLERNVGSDVRNDELTVDQLATPRAILAADIEHRPEVARSVNIGLITNNARDRMRDIEVGKHVALGPLRRIVKIAKLKKHDK